MQVVLQNPILSLNPRLHVWRSVAEPLVTSGMRERHRSLREVEAMLELVGLDPAISRRRPHELSGGQCQRVAIARAIISRPDLVVFDEAVTALDASVQVQVLNLIRDVQEERGFASVFISHDLAAVRYVATTSPCSATARSWSMVRWLVSTASQSIPTADSSWPRFAL